MTSISLMARVPPAVSMPPLFSARRKLGSELSDAVCLYGTTSSWKSSGGMMSEFG